MSQKKKSKFSIHKKTALFEGGLWLSEQGRAYDAAIKRGYDRSFRQFQRDLKNNPKVLPINPNKYKS